jgi:hypothetical protein
MSRRTTRSSWIATTAISAMLLITGCGTGTSPGGNSVEPATVERDVVDIVERSAAAVGGTWEVSSGPSVETCGEGADDKARYVYIMERSGTAGTDPTADVRTMQDFWDGAGIATTPYQSGGSDPLLGMRGKGGPTTSIAFNAYPQRYSITAVSECADGDVSDLRKSE